MNDLRIKTDQTISEISKYLVGIVNRDHSEGVILGLSGGLDSSVLAALAVRALGSKAVSVAYLFDRDSDTVIADNARLVAESLGLKLEIVDITEDIAKLGVYTPLFTKLLRFSKIVAQVSSWSYKFICGESPFRSTLRVGGGETLAP